MMEGDILAPKEPGQTHLRLYVWWPFEIYELSSAGEFSYVTVLHSCGSYGCHINTIPLCEIQHQWLLQLAAILGLMPSVAWTVRE